MTKVSENHEGNNANTVLAIGFQPIKNLNLKRKNSKVIVTNNLTAADANGQMSHIWIVGLVQKSKGEYIAFTDGDTKIHNITHFCELP